MIDSPVNSLFKQLIKLDKSLQQPLYLQASAQIVNAIQRNYLTKGTVLPGTRSLSQLLNIHRNTAVAIYEELASQGWVEIIPNKGTFVLEPKLLKSKIKASTQKVNAAYSYAETTGFPFQKSMHLTQTDRPSNAKYSINDGQPDLRLHPVHQFSRWYSAAMKRKSLVQKWNRTQIQNSLFRTQLCNYLNATRGFHINPNNVLNTRSIEMSLFVVAQLLINPKDIVLVGNLSNYNANTIFQETGAKIKTIPIDNDGLQVDYIKKHFVRGAVRCVYICANRDYPTGVTLSAERRIELLKLAEEYGFAIIEDDYDYDFQYDGSPMLPMASADANGMVIYLGKLGQSLFPSFQTGFIIAPKNLISEAKNYLELLDKQGDLIQEQMLSELIEEGELYRLLKKNIVIYKQRRDFLNSMLKQHFGDIAHWEIPSGGLAFWLEFQPKISLLKLARQAEKEDLHLPNTILYQDKHTCALRFGFGHLNEEELQEVIIKLKTAYDKL